MKEVGYRLQVAAKEEANLQREVSMGEANHPQEVSMEEGSHLREEESHLLEASGEQMEEGFLR